MPDVFMLAVGLLVMALLLYLIALTLGGWLSLLGILGLAVVWIGWYRHVVRLAFQSLGVDPDDEDDDLPSFPG